MDESQLFAIQLTELGLEFGREYTYRGISAYMLQGADGTEFVVLARDKTGQWREGYMTAGEAAARFAELAWSKS